MEGILSSTVKNKHIDRTGGIALPYLGYMETYTYGQRMFFCPRCPKQGMVLLAERLKPRLRTISFLSL